MRCNQKQGIFSFGLKNKRVPGFSATGLSSWSDVLNFPVSNNMTFTRLQYGVCMDESSKFPKSWTLEIQFFKPAIYPQKWIISCLNVKLCLDNLKINQRSYHNLPNSTFWGWLSMESQPQNPEFRINHENLHRWICSCVNIRPFNQLP